MWYTDNSNFGGQNDEIFIRKRDSSALEHQDANEYRRKFQIQLENEKRAKYNPDNIFKNNEKKLDVKAEEVALVEYNEYKWYKKIIMKIKNLFKRK